MSYCRVIEGGAGCITLFPEALSNGLVRTQAAAVQFAHAVRPPSAIAPNFRPRASSCGHGCRSLGRTEIREGGHPYKASTMLAFFKAGSARTHHRRKRLGTGDDLCQDGIFGTDRVSRSLPLFYKFRLCDGEKKSPAFLYEPSMGVDQVEF